MFMFVTGKLGLVQYNEDRSWHTFFPRFDSNFLYNCCLLGSAFQDREEIVKLVPGVVLNT